MRPREILSHLEDAERQVVEGERSLVTQRRIIERLQASRQDASHSIELLQEFEQLQQSHIAYRDHLLEQYRQTALSNNDADENRSPPH
jgi:hypothetical protein